MKTLKFMKFPAAGIILILLLHACGNQMKNNTMDLSGEWTFAADPGDKGITDQWYNRRFNETVILPGSMTENGKGDEIGLNTPWTGSIFDSSWFHLPEMARYREPGNIRVPFWLQPDKYYAGAAWYQKEVTIPASWKNRNIELYLERCHWETRVWVDDHEAGMQNSLAAPHTYNLSKWLLPGKHTITLCVDNRVKSIDVGRNSHSISDHTQTNWNGIVGKLALVAKPPLHIGDVKIYPDIHRKLVNVKLEIVNTTGSQLRAKVRLKTNPVNHVENEKQSVLDTTLVVSSGSRIVELNYSMGSNPVLWDEFNPGVYDMTIRIKGANGEEDSRKTSFGMREFKVSGTRFSVNGRPAFLRGTLECAIFPATGYPPTDTASWMRIFKIARAHGLNHIRFHSWCPPEAAFVAADLAGFYLQVECSSWANQGTTIGDGKPVDKFIYDESERIVNEYGNHPSFCILLYGNEPAGEHQGQWLGKFITYWKNKDPRRLYSGGAGWPVLPENDFNSTPDPRVQGWGEELNSIINAQPPGTDFDWSDRIADFRIPVVSHEIGQWCVYPDFKEIPLYNGVLKARNFEIFKDILAENNLISLADSFLMASGKLQAICYKADIEAALRTPGFGGFQLLDLHDFPGQGTALVGVLNAFWGEKGYITAPEFRKFCNATVVLARLLKVVFLNNEVLNATFEIAHFGNKEIRDAIPVWKLSDTGGKIIWQGKLPSLNIPIGNGTRLGEIKQSLAAITAPQKLTLGVQVNEIENSWDIWVYPASLPEIRDETWVTQQLDNNAMRVLENGGSVLFTPKKGSLKTEYGGNIAAGFSSIFWNTAWTGGQAPHTLGILCNPDHPALHEFPAEFHSNWQWWDAMSHSNAIDLSSLPVYLKPIVRVIDDWFTGRPLALVFEVKVGNGNMIISGIDLLTGIDRRPEARQLLYSLKKYMAGNSFRPSVNVELEELRTFFNN